MKYIYTSLSEVDNGQPQGLRRESGGRMNESEKEKKREYKYDKYICLFTMRSRYRLCGVCALVIIIINILLLFRGVQWDFRFRLQGMFK